MALHILIPPCVFFFLNDFVCLYCRETFSSGILTLDLALGGGLPKGRVVEVWTCC